MQSTASYCEPHVAFNAFVTESIVVLDACGTRAEQLAGSAWIDSDDPLASATAAALRRVMEDLTPDNTKRALLLSDAESDPRTQWVHDWLLSDGGCAEVLVVERSRLVHSHGFLMGRSVMELPVYPNEIVPGHIFLGSKASVNEHSLSHLRVTHVLSLLDRQMAPPANTVHLLCRLKDVEDADLTPIMLEALRFIRQALDAGGRVLVHCDRGASRSASVVAAHLMLDQNFGPDAALRRIAEQRPCVAPNAGFLAQLRLRAWSASLAAHSEAAAVTADDARVAAPPAEGGTAEGGTAMAVRPPLQPIEYTHGSRKRIARPGDGPQVSADVPEIQISTAWASMLEPAVRPQPRPLEGAAAEYGSGARLLLIDGLFSPSECARLVRAAEAVGFGRTSYPRSYRGNLRLITVDLSLADACWERLRPLVPAEVEMHGEVYEAVGLNECWRLAKYRAGDRFGAHVDACFERSPHEISLFTVNVYMNAVPPEAGGATRFFPHADGRRLRNEQEAILRVSPEPGLAVVFRQPPGEELLHDGEALAAGVKFLFRSDVMYRRRG